jgi:hypothetical protein
MRKTGSSQCTSCSHYANSTALLCAINPTHARGSVCFSFEEEVLPLGDYRDHITILPWNPPCKTLT